MLFTLHDGETSSKTFFRTKLDFPFFFKSSCTVGYLPVRCSWKLLCVPVHTAYLCFCECVCLNCSCKNSMLFYTGLRTLNIQSNLCTTTTLETANWRLLLTGGRCSMLFMLYKSNWHSKIVVAIGRWSRFGVGRYQRFDCNQVKSSLFWWNFLKGSFK